MADFLGDSQESYFPSIPRIIIAIIGWFLMAIVVNMIAIFVRIKLRFLKKG